MLKLPRRIIVKTKEAGKKIVAVTGSIGDWAAYYVDENDSWDWDKIAEEGHKLYSNEIDDFFKLTKKVKNAYRR
jgi:hypothetical protein